MPQRVALLHDSQRSLFRAGASGRPTIQSQGFAEVMLNLSIVICFVAISLSFSRFGIVFSLHRAHCLLSLDPFPDIRRTLTEFYAPPFLASEEANHVDINQCHLSQI